MARRNLGPEPLPLPPSGEELKALFAGKLPSVTLRSGSRLWRTQLLAYRDPLYFGDPKRRFNRFDLAPAACPDSAGCLYTSKSPEGAFIEVFGHATGIRCVTETELRSRGLFPVETKRPCRLVSLTGGNLAKLGLDARIWSGDVATAQRWATAFYQHPLRYDGILYPCRHDDRQTAVALFDRVRPDLGFSPPVCWLEHPELAGFLDHYDFGLI